MTTTYVRSTDGSNGDDGATWAAAKANVANGLSQAGAGSRVYVSDAHSESTAGNVTLAASTSPASPNEIVCGDDAAEPPTAVADTGVVAATGTVLLTFTGFAYYRGITFQVGSGSASGAVNLHVGTTSPTPLWHRFERCGLALLSTGAAARINLGQGLQSGVDDQRVECIDTAFVFGHVSQGISPGGHVTIVGGTMAATGTVPDTLIKPGGDKYCNLIVRDVDLSALGSGKALVDVSVASSSGYVLFENCKLGANVAVTSGSNVGPGGVTVEVVNCDSSDTNYRYQKHCYEGDIYSETTIVRTGGASDGTTAIARKMVSSANARFVKPLESSPSVIWNETTGSSVTVTMFTVTDNVTLTDAEAWIEVEYLGTSGVPHGAVVSDRCADILATAANQTTDSSTWTTTGLTTPIKQKLSVSFTPLEKGPIRVRVMLARASTTVYVDPLVEVS